MTQTFLLDVNRNYVGKEAHTAGEDGKKPSGVKFNNTFATERITADQLIEEVIAPGYSYAQGVFDKVDPSEHKGIKRAVFSKKITENWTSAQLLTLDFDTGTPDLVETLEKDEWLMANAFAIAHSASSIPGVKEKVHVLFLFESQVNDIDQWRIYLRAACTRFEMADWLVDALRTVFNGVCRKPDEDGVYQIDEERLIVLGNTVSHAEWNREIVYPYISKSEKAKATAEEQRKTIIASTPLASDDDSLRQHLANRLNGIERYLAGKSNGRNAAICSCSYLLGKIAMSPWAKPAWDMLTETKLEDMVARCGLANGYDDQYGRGDGEETRRVFRLSFHAANSPEPEPILRKKTVGNTHHPQVITQKELDEAYDRGYRVGFEDGLEFATKLVRQEVLNIFSTRVKGSADGIEVLYENWDGEPVGVEHIGLDGKRELKVGGNHLFITEQTIRDVQQAFVFLDGPTWAMETFYDWLSEFQEETPSAAFFGAPCDFTKETVSFLHGDYFSAPRVVFVASDNTPIELQEACCEWTIKSPRAYYLKLPTSTPPTAKDLVWQSRQVTRTPLTSL